MNQFRSELNEIVPVDFLKKFKEEQVTSAIRYCRALQIRIDRAYVSPEKDKIKTELLAPHAEKLKKLKIEDPSPVCLELIQEYARMLEEYKISLFAQEMKTNFPVSPKRLKNKWQEIMQSCQF
jgi:ATP-dependent helicase HrpA